MTREEELRSLEKRIKKKYFDRMMNNTESKSITRQRIIDRQFSKQLNEILDRLNPHY